MGNLLSITIHAANIHDTKGGVYTFEKAVYKYPTLQGVCADGGYQKHFKEIFEEFHNLKVEISKRLSSTFKILPKRWRIERTFAWFNNSRRLSKDYEISSSSEEAFCYISHFANILKRF